MRKIVKTGAAALMLTCMAGNIWAATAASAGCARPEDVSAVRTAAVQQKLMVAALSCHAVELYNKFVVTYQKDLQASDKALQNFFRRMNGKTGTADYHTFKTKLANASSMESISNITDYCSRAQTAFDSALSDDKKSLTVFLAGQTTAVDDAFSSCQYRTAGTASAPAPQEAPLPRVKPGDAVVPAEGEGLAVPQ